MEVGEKVWLADRDDILGDHAFVLGSVEKRDEKEITVKLFEVYITANNESIQFLTRERIGYTTNDNNNDEIATTAAQDCKNTNTEYEYEGVFLANSDEFNDEDSTNNSTNDLISLPHLHEPAILCALSSRFLSSNLIYVSVSLLHSSFFLFFILGGQTIFLLPNICCYNRNLNLDNIY